MESRHRKRKAHNDYPRLLRAAFCHRHMTQGYYEMSEKFQSGRAELRSLHPSEIGRIFCSVEL
jgi:hypothetical protein